MCHDSQADARFQSITQGRGYSIPEILPVMTSASVTKGIDGALFASKTASLKDLELKMCIKN